MPLDKPTNRQAAGHKFSAVFMGVLILSGLIILVNHFGELTEFVALVRQAKPVWLILALVLQLATYICVAGVWYQALRHVKPNLSFVSLIPLSIGKLFSDQAMPSGGMSGTAFFVTALTRRGVPSQMCMAAMLLSLFAYYGAYILVAVLTMLLLWLYHAIHAWIIAVMAIFVVVAVGLPAGALWLRRQGSNELPLVLLQIPGLKKLMDDIAAAPGNLLQSPRLIVATMALHASIFVLDATTLWVMLQVVGIQVSFWVAFPSFVLASIAATIGPIPLGLGTFEVTCVGMLGALGVPVEAALTATLLLRGFTLWLPMLPGMWLARSALR